MRPAPVLEGTESVPVRTLQGTHHPRRHPLTSSPRSSPPRNGSRPIARCWSQREGRPHGRDALAAERRRPADDVRVLGPVIAASRVLEGVVYAGRPVPGTQPAAASIASGSRRRGRLPCMDGIAHDVSPHQVGPLEHLAARDTSLVLVLAPASRSRPDRQRGKRRHGAGTPQLVQTADRHASSREDGPGRLELLRARRLPTARRRALCSSTYDHERPAAICSTPPAHRQRLATFLDADAARKLFQERVARTRPSASTRAMAAGGSRTATTRPPSSPAANPSGAHNLANAFARQRYIWYG